MRVFREILRLERIAGFNVEIQDVKQHAKDPDKSWVEVSIEGKPYHYLLDKPLLDEFNENRKSRAWLNKGRMVSWLKQKSLDTKSLT
jgi:hypothetical protein